MTDNLNIPIDGEYIQNKIINKSHTTIYNNVHRDLQLFVWRNTGKIIPQIPEDFVDQFEEERN